MDVNLKPCHKLDISQVFCRFSEVFFQDDQYLAASTFPLTLTTFTVPTEKNHLLGRDGDAGLKHDPYGDLGNILVIIVGFHESKMVVIFPGGYTSQCLIVELFGT